MNEQDFLLRIITCFALSFCIGLERQWRRRTIGLRTNVLVSIGAFLFVTTGIDRTGDVTRIPAQVVSGIGFLGAGVILRDGANIKGLNTAATLWCNAAIGVMTATGLLLEAAIGTVFILISNIALRFIGRKMMKKQVTKEEYTLKIVCVEEKEAILRALLLQLFNAEHITLTNLESRTIENEVVKIYATVHVVGETNHTIEQLVNRISMEPGVTNIGWKKTEQKTKEEIEEEEEEN